MNKYGYIGMITKTSFVDVKALTSGYNYYWVFAYCKDENGKMYPGLTAHYVYGKAQKCSSCYRPESFICKGWSKTYMDEVSQEQKDILYTDSIQAEKYGLHRYDNKRHNIYR